MYKGHLNNNDDDNCAYCINMFNVLFTSLLLIQAI